MLVRTLQLASCEFVVVRALSCACALRVACVLVVLRVACLRALRELRICVSSVNE